MAENGGIVPDPGPILAGRFAVRVRVRAEHTGGVMSVLEETLPPRVLVPPHIHQNDVWVKVDEGEIGVLVGDDVRSALQGQWALKPREVRHAMWNPTDGPARVTEVMTPAGSERWFEEVSALADGDEAAFLNACRRHGITFLDDQSMVDRLRNDFGLV